MNDRRAELLATGITHLRTLGAPPTDPGIYDGKHLTDEGRAEITIYCRRAQAAAWLIMNGSALASALNEAPQQNVLHAAAAVADQQAKWERAKAAEPGVGVKTAAQHQSAAMACEMVRDAILKLSEAPQAAQPGGPNAVFVQKLRGIAATMRDCDFDEDHECATLVDRAANELAARPVQAAQPGGVEDHLRHVIDRDRYVAAIVFNNFKKMLGGYDWLRGPARGCYEYDDKTYQAEFGGALDAFEAALAPLAKLAWDKTDCTTDPDKVVAANVAGRERFAELATPPEGNGPAFADGALREISDLADLCCTLAQLLPGGTWQRLRFCEIERRLRALSPDHHYLAQDGEDGRVPAAPDQVQHD